MALELFPCMLFGELVSACSCAGRSEKLTGFKKYRRKEKFPSSAATPKPLPAALEPSDATAVLIRSALSVFLAYFAQLQLLS